MAQTPPALHLALHAHLQLNLVERWFAELSEKWIKRGSHRSVRDLVASIRTWIEGWNEDPKPYVWHKSADEILREYRCLLSTNQRLRSLGNIMQTSARLDYPQPLQPAVARNCLSQAAMDVQNRPTYTANGPSRHPWDLAIAQRVVQRHRAAVALFNRRELETGLREDRMVADRQGTGQPDIHRDKSHHVLSRLALADRNRLAPAQPSKLAPGNKICFIDRRTRLMEETCVGLGAVCKLGLSNRPIGDRADHLR